MREETKVALFIGLPGGIAYAEAVIAILGRLMAWSWPSSFANTVTSSTELNLYMGSLVMIFVVLCVVAFPFALVLRFLFGKEALIASVALAVGAFFYINATTSGALLALWSHLINRPIPALTDTLLLYGGPIALVWLLARRQAESNEPVSR